MKVISNKVKDEERAFYGSQNVHFNNIKIEGPIDGESAFKECKKIIIENSSFDLRYPCWHDNGCLIFNSTMSSNCRAAFWYDKNLTIKEVDSNGIKAVRECKNVLVDKSTFNSEEFGWQCENIKIINSKIKGNYAFLQSKNVSFENVKFEGKYSFQYVKNLDIIDSNLDTKDAFWHSKNATVKNSIIKGEYLGWYSENLTLINCKIIGTQPLCYCKNLTIIDCTFEDCDLAFEYSEVNGNIIGNIDSIKNPLKGNISMNVRPVMIIDENDKSKGQFSLKIS